MDRSRGFAQGRRSSSMVTHNLQVGDCNAGALGSISNDVVMEVTPNDNLMPKRHYFWVVFNETFSCLKR